MSYITEKNKYIFINSKKTAYRELGLGMSDIPLIMLTHLAATLDNWDPKLIDLIAENNHVILLELPGVGASEGSVAGSIEKIAEQALEIIRHMGYSKINLMGLSMGGMVAQEIVRIDNKLVNKLILAGTGYKGGEGIKNIIPVTLKHIMNGLIHRVDPKRYIFYNHNQKGKNDAEIILGRMAARKDEYKDRKMNIKSFIRQLKAIKKWGESDKDDLSFINIPALIVNGDKDMMVPTSNSYYMYSKIKGSRLIIYQDAGHGSIFQYAEKFANDMSEFIKKV